MSYVSFVFSHFTRRLRRVGETDRALMRRSAAIPRTRADQLLTLLSRSANKGRLWWVVALVLSVRKGSVRRGALRGVVAIAGASITANLIAKPIFPRRRPAAEEVPEHRRLAKRPTSSSFPSGHSASAAAFATAVAMESPKAALAVAPLAAAVAYSRVHTGVHWPSDVGAGIAIGTTVGIVTKHWWLRHPETPVQTEHGAPAPAMVDGKNMIAMVNPHSGPDGENPAEEVQRAWPKATVLNPAEDIDIQTQLTREIAERNGEVQALAVAGGDGTVAAVAAVAAEHDLPLALVPAGTLNHFARDIGITSIEEADEATETGAAVGIDLGEVNISCGGETERRWFVNTASLGGYPEMVRLREKLEDKLPKWPAAALALLRVLRRARPWEATFNGEKVFVWILFVGNGSYDPKGFAPSRRPALDTGLLDVRYLRADLPYSRARFMLAMLTNTLRTSHVYRQFDLRELEVKLLEGNKRIATDGEVGPLGDTFCFRANRSALTIYRKEKKLPANQ